MKSAEICLAPGVIFDGTKHEYWYNGKQLSGITGVLSKKLGLKNSNEFTGEHQEEEIHVHKAVQKWIETGDSGSVHPGVQWVVEVLDTLKKEVCFFSEVLVSDFKKYASPVDIVYVTLSGKKALNIADLKTGKFNRDYATWQLSIYKYLIEKYSDWDVNECTVLCFQDKEAYPIVSKDAVQVEKLLYGLSTM